MSTTSSVLNSYYAAASTYQSHISNSDRTLLAAELKNVQILYRKALVEVSTKNQNELPKLQKRNAEILSLSKDIITTQLDNSSTKILRLQKEIDQATTHLVDMVAKTVIRLNVPVALGSRLTIHGEGGNLNWEKGLPISRLSDGTLGIETNGKLKYKVKLDGQWENWGDRTIESGKTETITPAIKMPISALTVRCKPTQVSKNDTIYIRGEGSVKIGGILQNLSWDKGIPLTRVDDQFILLLDEPADLKYKLIVNEDKNRWSTDNDRFMKKGETVEFETNFNGQAPVEDNTPKIGSRIATNTEANMQSVAKIKSRVNDSTTNFDFT